jgi:hypothetical protein
MNTSLFGISLYKFVDTDVIVAIPNEEFPAWSFGMRMILKWLTIRRLILRSVWMSIFAALEVFNAVQVQRSCTFILEPRPKVTKKTLKKQELDSIHCETISWYDSDFNVPPCR